MIKYKNVLMLFDTDKFADDLLKEVKILVESGKTLEDIAIGEIGVSVGTLKKWYNGIYSNKAPYPSMTNFLVVCNVFGFDAREYFVLEK